MNQNFVAWRLFCVPTQPFALFSTLLPWIMRKNNEFSLSRFLHVLCEIWKHTRLPPAPWEEEIRHARQAIYCELEKYIVIVHRSVIVWVFRFTVVFILCYVFFDVDAGTERKLWVVFVKNSSRTNQKRKRSVIDRLKKEFWSWMNSRFKQSIAPRNSKNSSKRSLASLAA